MNSHQVISNYEILMISHKILNLCGDKKFLLYIFNCKMVKGICTGKLNILIFSMYVRKKTKTWNDLFRLTFECTVRTVILDFSPVVNCEPSHYKLLQYHLNYYKEKYKAVLDILWTTHSDLYFSFLCYSYK